MSPLSRLLHRSFCTSLSATNPKSPPFKSLMGDLFKEQNPSKMVEMFKSLSKMYQFRNKYGTYELTVRRLASAKQFSLIEEILEDQKNYPNISREGFAIRLISLYGESSMFDHAFKMFNQLPELKCNRTVKSFNALLNACADSKNFDKVEKLFRELPSNLSITPDEYSYTIVIRAFCEMGSFDSAVSMLDEMEKNGIKPNLITFNTLLNAFYGKGRFLDGEKIWARMEKSDVVPNIRSFNAKLQGLVLEGKTSEAVKLVEVLGTMELKPDAFSYHALIEGFINDGDIEEVKRLYNDMLKNDCIPIRRTYKKLVPYLCEKGEFDLAFKLCKNGMSYKRLIDVELVQVVLDGLVNESKVEEAKKLLELGKLKNYDSLKMPTGIFHHVS